MKFRKKPVMVEAHQLTSDNWQEILAWGDNHGVLMSGGGPSGGVTISTLEGDMTANVGDWIIKGVKGEMYPCKPDVFAATYDPAE